MKSTHAACAILIALLLSLASPPLHARQWRLLPAPAVPLPDLHGIAFTSVDSGFVCGSRRGVGVLYRTSDGGTTWDSVPIPAPPARLSDLVVDASHAVIAGSGGYVALSSDGGSSWSLRSIPSTVWSSGGDVNRLHLRGARIVAVGGASSGSGPRMAVSDDLGRTWRNVSFAGARNNLYAIDFLDDDNGIVLGTGNPPRRSRTTDGGATWESNATMTLLPAAAASLSYYDLRHDPRGATLVAGGGKSFAWPQYGEVRVSTDRGGTWLATALSGVASPAVRPLEALQPIGDQVILAAGRGGVVWATSDGGMSWGSDPLPTPIGSRDLHDIELLSSNDLYVVGEGGTVLHTRLAPLLASAVDSIRLATLEPGERRSVDLTLGNTGDAWLHLEDLDVVGMQGVVAGVEPSLGSGRIAPSERAAVGVAITLSAGAPPGLHRGWLRITSDHLNGEDGGRGGLVPLEILVCTKTLQVATGGSTDAGSTRAGSAVANILTLPNILRNTGDCAIAITNLRLARGTDFSIVSPVPPQTLVPQGGLTVTLEFLPQAACVRRDTLIIEHDADNPAPIRIPLSGTGTVPSLQVRPVDTLDFGGVLVNTTAVDTLRLRNDEPNQCLDMTRLDTVYILGPNRTEFAILSPVRRNTMLAPNSELAIPISARPTVPGRRTATVYIRSELTSSLPDSVILLVNGLEPKLTTVKTEIAFSLTDVGGRRDSTLNDFLQNLSNASVTIQDVSVQGLNASDFIVTSPAGATSIGIGEKRPVVVSFLPSAPGRRTAILRMVTSAGTIDVNLRGDADYATMRLARDQLILSPTDIGACRDTIIERFFANNGPVPLRFDSVVVLSEPGNSGPDDSLAFTILEPSPPPQVVVLPGDSIRLRLRFCPNREGVFFARVLLYTNTVEDTASIRLIATARSVRLLLHDSVVFADTRVLQTRDTSVAPMIVNRLSAPVRIDSITVSGADASSFTLLGPATPFSLDGGGFVAMRLRFNPLRRARHSAILTLHTSLGAQRLDLLGQAIYPFLEIVPENPGQMRVRVGTSRRVRILVTNAGDDISYIEQLAFRGSPAYSNATIGALPRRLEPGEALPIDVDFAPATLCEHDAEIDLLGEGVRGIYRIADTTVQLTGIGVAPMIGGPTSTISFGPRPPGGSYDTVLTDFLRNYDFTRDDITCVDSTVIDSMRIVGPDAGSFALIVPASPTTPQLSPAGATHPLTIRFSPATPGLRSATLEVFFDGRGDSVARIELVGAGSVLPIRFGPTPGMTSIDFGKRRVGWIHDSIFTVENISSDPLVLDRITAPAASEFEIVAPAPPVTLLPGVPVVITVRFAPVAAPGLRTSFVTLGSGALADSSFLLRGFGVLGNFRRVVDTLDMGNVDVGTSRDSGVAVTNLATTAIPLPLLDDAAIDTVVIVGSSEFQVLSYPLLLAADERDSVRVRFTPAPPLGARLARLRIFYDRHRIATGGSVVDSLDVVLVARATGDVVVVEVSLGGGVTGSPGDRLRVPIDLGAGIAAANSDSLDVRLRYRRTQLRPTGFVSSVGGSGTIVQAPATPGVEGEALLRIVSPTPLAPGRVGELELLILLPDTLASPVAIDSGGVAERSDVVVAGDTILFTIDEFCEPESRLIRFGEDLSLASRPNPIRGSALLRYTLPAEGPVRLTLVDAAGNEVARFVDAWQGPGAQEVPVDLGAYPSGVYRCVLTAGRFTRVITLQIAE